jgi:hypothetical protein
MKHQLVMEFLAPYRTTRLAGIPHKILFSPQICGGLEFLASLRRHLALNRGLCDTLDRRTQRHVAILEKRSPAPTIQTGIFVRWRHG